MVERWFAEIRQKRIRRGFFESVSQLIAAIEDYLAHYNEAPKRFVWTSYKTLRGKGKGALPEKSWNRDLRVAVAVAHRMFFSVSGATMSTLLLSTKPAPVFMCRPEKP